MSLIEKQKIEKQKFPYLSGKDGSTRHHAGTLHAVCAGKRAASNSKTGNSGLR